MKKILLIQHWGSVGGAGISLYNTWKSLQPRYNVTAYIPGSTSGLYDFLKAKGLNPKTYSFTCGQIPYYSGGSNIFKPGFWYLIVNSILQIPYWKKVISDEQPDLVIVNSKVLCWMSGLLKKTKSVCFVRETIKGSYKNLINRIMKRNLEKFTLVAFLSEYDLVQTDLKKAMSVVSTDFLYIEDYQDNHGREYACEQLGVPVDGFNVAFVGGIDKLKGIDIAVRAMEILKNKNVNLLVAGVDIGNTNENSSNYILKIMKRKSVKFSKKIKSFIDNKEINCSIKFVGVQNDVSLFFSASDVLIFPMKEPHQARPAFEIGAQKKPVIISDFANIHEFIKDGVNGLTFEPDNPQSLADAILRLKNDRDLLERLGSKNYDYTKRLHTEEYSMGELIKKIDEILQ